MLDPVVRSCLPYDLTAFANPHPASHARNSLQGKRFPAGPTKDASQMYWIMPPLYVYHLFPWAVRETALPSSRTTPAHYLSCLLAARQPLDLLLAIQQPSFIRSRFLSIATPSRSSPSVYFIQRPVLPSRCAHASAMQSWCPNLYHISEGRRRRESGTLCHYSSTTSFKRQHGQWRKVLPRAVEFIYQLWSFCSIRYSACARRTSKYLKRPILFIKAHSL